MTRDDWTEWADEWADDHDDVDYAPPRVPRPGPQELYSVRYPRRQAPRPAPPADLKGRARRRAERDTRRAERAERNRTAADWRRTRPAGQTAGLGVVLLIVAVGLAAFILWPRGQADTSSSGSRGVDTAPTRSSAPTSTAAAPVPGFAGTPAELLPQFLTAYSAYSPTDTDAAETWVGRWSALATADVADAGRRTADRLWQFTVQQEVWTSISNLNAPELISTLGEQQVWQVDGELALHPLDGAADPAPANRPVRYRVTIGQASSAPVVTAVAVLPAPTTATPARGSATHTASHGSTPPPGGSE